MRQTRLSGLQRRCPGAQSSPKLACSHPRSARSGAPSVPAQAAQPQSRRAVRVQAAPSTLAEREAAPSQAEDVSSPPDRQQQPEAGPSSSGYEAPQGDFRPGFRPRGNWQGSAPMRQPIPLEGEPPCKVGELVVATVVWTGERGMRATLDVDPSIKGFVPISQTPYILRDNLTQPRQVVMHMPIGVTREFLVLSLPEGGLEHHGRGPLLSAKEPDREICWRRCTQMMEICDQEGEYVMLRIDSANRGGLVGNFEGVVVFIPFSRIPRENSNILTPEDLEELWVGKTVPCVIEQVEPHNNKIIGNIKAAMSNQHTRKMQIGSVIWGKVARILDFGAFIRPDEAAVDCLLHVSSISRSHVDNPNDVFQVGDRVRVLVVSLQDQGRRVGVSTAALEVSQGDMIHNKEAVYETAEQMAQTWMESRQNRPERGPRGSFEDRDGGSGYGNRRRQDSFNDFGFDEGPRSSGEDNFDDIWN